jgi:hypothetical protein
MGAFWNPNGGIIIDGKRLSKKEVSLLKRKWSGHCQVSSGFWSRFWAKAKLLILIFFR